METAQSPVYPVSFSKKWTKVLFHCYYYKLISGQKDKSIFRRLILYRVNKLSNCAQMVVCYTTSDDSNEQCSHF